MAAMAMSRLVRMPPSTHRMTRSRRPSQFFLQIVKIIAAASVKVGIPPAFPHPVVDCCFPSPLSIPLHPSWPPLLPHRCRPINLRHRLFNSLPLLMIRHADCRPLIAASTAASNASYPPFKTGVNKINNVRFQPSSPPLHRLPHPRPNPLTCPRQAASAAVTSQPPRPPRIIYRRYRRWRPTDGHLNRSIDGGVSLIATTGVLSAAG